MADTLVKWKQKRDKHCDECNEEYDDEVKSPRLSHSLQNVTFIKSDEVNAKTMRIMKVKW
jgi:hypothetical protein